MSFRLFLAGYPPISTVLNPDLDDKEVTGLREGKREVAKEKKTHKMICFFRVLATDMNRFA